MVGVAGDGRDCVQGKFVNGPQHAGVREGHVRRQQQGGDPLPHVGCSQRGIKPCAVADSVWVQVSARSAQGGVDFSAVGGVIVGHASDAHRGDAGAGAVADDSGEGGAD